MSFRYRKEWGESGDLAVRRLWNENMAEMAGAFTRLDRENLPVDAIPAANIANNTFTTFASLGHTASATLSGSSTRWIRSVSSAELLYVTITMPSDGMLIANLSMTWAWLGSASGGWSSSTVESGMLSWRLVLDGREIARAPRHSIIRGKDSTHLVGSSIVSAGPHEIWMETQSWTDPGFAAQGVDYELRERELVVMGRTR